MSFNIMDLVKDQLTDQVMGQIGGLLGEEPEVTQSAMGGAIPAILSGLGGIAGNERGAESLFNAVKDQDDGLLDNLGDMLTGDNSGSMIEMGTKILGGLMGNNGLGSLIGALAGFSGMGKKSSSSLIGLLAPIVLGIVKRKIFGGNSGGTIGALTSLFADQKDNIANSMPKAMNDQLTTDGFLDSITGNFADTAEQTVEAAQEQVQAAASGGSSLLRKLLPIIILIALGWLALQFFGGQNQSEPMSQSETSGDAPDYGSQVTTMFENTTDTFGKITDTTTATEQLPNLKSLVEDFTGFSTELGGLDDAVKGPVITLAKDAFTGLEPVVEKTVALPGVGDIIKPTTDSLMETISKMLE